MTSLAGHTRRKRNAVTLAIAGAGVGLLVLITVVFAYAADVPVPPPPGAVTAVPGSAPPVVARLSWGASNGAVGYAVYVGTDVDGPYDRAGTTSGTAFDFSDGFAGTPYYFRVTAIAADGAESSPAQGGPVTATWKSSPHVAASSATYSCNKCHELHDAEGSNLMRVAATTSTSAELSTCYACHDGRGALSNVKDGDRDSFSLASGHSLDAGSPPASLTASCSSCHDVHQDSTAFRMLPQSTVNGRTVTSAGRDWCLACHDDANSWYGAGYPSPSEPTIDASGYPITGTWLGPATYASPTNAHRLIPEATQTPSGIAIRRQEGDCLYCHAAHRGPNRFDALVNTFRSVSQSTLASDQAQGAYAAACLDCHGGVMPSGFATAPVDIKQFITSATPNAGHRIKTAGGTLPVGAPLPCYECHNPHGSTRGNASLISDTLGQDLATGTNADVRAFCFTCHATSDTAKGWDSVAATYTAITSTDTVVGLSRMAGALRLPAASGHAEADTAGCDDCHGSDYSKASSINVHNPGTGSAAAVHTFSAASDYSNLTVSGCTNSGAGCHGSDATYSNFTTYHPTSGCTTGACHSSPSKATYVGDRECSSCHDANYEGASDVIALGANVPDGHYGETSHTPTGMSAVVTAGGTASAVCSNCHDPVSVGGPNQLYNQHQGLPGPYATNVTCADCHNANPLVMSIVTGGGWATKDCATCHNTGVLLGFEQHGTIAPVATGSTTDTCLGSGCHTTSDLHALHKDAVGGCALAGCHDYTKQAAKPTATTCGTGGMCHNTGSPHGTTGSHTASTSQECVDCHGSPDVTVVHTGGCGTCHGNPAYLTLPTGKTPECTNCHNGTDVGTHAYTPVDPNHYGETTHTASPFDAASQSAGPDGLVPAGGKECSTCHSAALKTAHAATSTSGGSVTCAECHTDTTLDSSATVAAGWPTRRCVECHDYGPATAHDSFATTHTVSPGTCAGTGPSCHNYTDLAQLHAVSQSGGPPTYQSCANADSTDPAACHNVLDNRPTAVDPAASCGQGTSGCHQDKTPANHDYDAIKHTATLGTGVVGLFSDHEFVGPVSYLVNCADCHNADLGATHARICSTCHPVPRNSFVNWDKTCSQVGCHPTYHGDTVAIHDAAAGGNCGRCHDETNFDMVPDPCGSCHALYDAADTIAPFTISDALAFYNGAGRIAFSVTDNGKIGVATTFYRLDGGSTALGDAVVVAEAGMHTLEFWSVDQNGNEETPHKAASFTTTADSIAPITTSNAKVAYEGPAVIALTAADASTLGVRNTYYSLNGGFTTTGRTVSIEPPETGTMTYTLSFWSDDYSGNAEVPNYVTFTVTRDITPPVTTCDAVDGSTYVGGQSFALTATDGNGTGVAETWYQLDSGTWTNGTSISVAAPPSDTASHTISWYSKDNAGNQETTKSVSFSVSWGANPSAPTLTAMPDADFNYDTDPPPTLTLEWTSVTVPDGDPCRYEIQLISQYPYSGPVDWASATVIPVTGTSYTAQFDGGFKYWRVTAIDSVHPGLRSEPSAVDQFTVNDGYGPYY